MKFYRYILLVTTFLMLVFLAGCAPEESDLTPPNAAFDGGVVTTPTASTTTFVSGTMDAGSTVSVYVTTSATVSGLTTSGETWSFTLNGMIEGSNIVQVSVADAVGNSRTIQLTIVVDLTGPVTTIDQYPVTAQAGTFTFAGTVTEADSTVTVDVYDSVPAIVASKTVPADADIWNADFTLGDDVYTVVATGTDRLFNDSFSPAQQVITIDSTLPSLIIDPLITLPVILNTDVDLLVFNGTTDVDNSLTVSPYATVIPPDAGGAWSATLSGIPNGKTVVTFDASDVLLNHSVQKVLVVRDQTAPFIVEWSSPAANEITVLFNETMATSTIDTSNLIVIDSTGADVAVNAVAADLTSKVFTFTTVDVLTDGTTYTVTLQTTDTFTVEDERGNSIAASYVWTFKKY